MRLVLLAVVLSVLLGGCAVAVGQKVAPRPTPDAPLNYWLPSDDRALMCTPFNGGGLCRPVGEVRECLGVVRVAP